MRCALAAACTLAAQGLGQTAGASAPAGAGAEDLDAAAAAAAALVGDVAAGASASAGEAARRDPDVGRDMFELVEAHGYRIERHYAVTRDGYILGMARMPLGKDEQPAGNAKPVVYLNHALLDSSWAFVCQGPGLSLGFLLADAGFDVWFGNNRGNKYSTNHTTLSTESREFWDFTYDDMALFDLPAHIEYVLGATGAETLSYVGHSQGTIQAFAGFSRNHTLADKINLFLAMAPVAYVHEQESPLLKAMSRLGSDKVFQLLGMKQFMTTKTGITKLGGWLCAIIPSGCERFIELVVGPANNINASRIDVFVSGTPSGTSVKNMVHWGQGMRREAFQMYDYGFKGNMKHYGQAQAPEFRLEDFTVPTVLITGDADYLADPLDVKTLLAKLPQNVLVGHINLPTYAHLDFTWAENAHTVLYPRMIHLLKDVAHGAATMVV